MPIATLSIRLFVYGELAAILLGLINYRYHRNRILACQYEQFDIVRLLAEVYGASPDRTTKGVHHFMKHVLLVT